MQRYLVVVLVVLVVVVVGVGCATKKRDVYYPKSHFTQVTLDTAKKEVVSVDWGIPLLYAEQTQTNQEVVKGKTNDVVYILVENKNTKQKGWVSEAHVVKNPLAKAALLNTASIYKTPSEVSRDFFTMVAPMIGYVVEIQENWARVQWYMSAYKVFTGKSDWTSYEWVKLSDISTNAKDADLLSLAYTSYRRLAEWSRNWTNVTDVKKKLSMSNDIEKEMIYLENVIKSYGGDNGPVSSTIYVRNIINSLQQLLYPEEEEEEAGYEEDEEAGYEGEY